jgi:hypothetical protein
MNALLEPELTAACERLKQSRNDCESVAHTVEWSAAACGRNTKRAGTNFKC